MVLPNSPDYQAARRACGLFAVQRPAAKCVATRIDNLEAALAYARAHQLRVTTETTGPLTSVLPDMRDTLLLGLALPDLDDPSSGAAPTRHAATERTR